jgi:peptidoglycan hydrolase-like protein with peptidoglycan-binding domain
MRTRWWLALVGVGAVAALTGAAVTGAGTDTDTSSPTDDADPATVDVETAIVERRDLVESDDFDGQLSYGAESKVPGAGSGVITALPDIGTTVGRGESLWEIDGNPGPRLLFGSRPMWRELRRGVDDGADVRQLEENLVALGHAPADLVVDDEFDASTTAAIKAWQEAQGVDETGVVRPSDVVFAPGDRRVSSHVAVVGDAPQGDVIGVTGVNQVVTLAVEAADVDTFTIGDEPLVELPDDSRVGGVVWSIADVATRDAEGGGATIEVVVALRETTRAFDAAPVDVIVTTTLAEDALTVPFRALLALSEGGYAVEKVTATGTELVGVELGADGDGVIQISGDIAEGDEVVVSL